MRYALLVTLAISAASFAEDPFACVDPDVADAFVGHSYFGRAEYSTSIPAGFTRLTVPAGSSLVGSQSTDSMTTVVYKSGMSTERALGAAIEALAESGWTEAALLHRGSGGFRGSAEPASAVLCHPDDPGTLSVLAKDASGKTFVSYAHHGSSPNCQGEDADQDLVHMGLPTLMRLLPTLKLPDGAKASDIGSSGSSDSVTSHVDVSGGTGRAELQSFIENQVRNQDWKYQTAWSSHVSSGSVWTQESAEHGTLIGTLHLFDSGADPVRVRFSVSPANPTGTDHGSWSVN